MVSHDPPRAPKSRKRLKTGVSPRITEILSLVAHDIVMRSLLLAVLPLLAGINIATAQEVAITARDCDRLVQHEPDASVAYVPNVDVRGRPVASADLPGSSQIVVPENFSIPITVDLAERFGIPLGSDVSTEVVIGQVDVEPGGRIFFNGQPLQDEAARQLSILCQSVDRSR